MPHNFTIIAYRASGTDMCRGHVMARYDSHHEVECSQDTLDIARAWAPYLLENRRHGESATEVTILIDGVVTEQEYRDGDYYEDEAEAARGRAYAALNAATGVEMARLREVEAQKAVAADKAKAKQVEAERLAAEAKERADFERLKAKFGP